MTHTEKQSTAWQRFILATSNRDKLAEIQAILVEFPFVTISMREAGFAGEIKENGATFEENALIKARAVHVVTGNYVCADDSGLMIDALDGAPGVLSARFAGEDTGYPQKIARIWELLQDVDPSRWDASFHCAIAVVNPHGHSFVVQGTCRGRIIPEMRGNNGFGYDPIFYIPALGMTTAEMQPAQKHEISHRGRALRRMVERLRRECDIRSSHQHHDRR